MSTEDDLSALKSEVETLRTELAELRTQLAKEVRTERVVVVSGDIERIKLEVEPHEDMAQVRLDSGHGAERHSSSAMLYSCSRLDGEAGTSAAGITFETDERHWARIESLYGEPFEFASGSN